MKLRSDRGHVTDLVLALMIIVPVVAIILGLMFGIPKYRLWKIDYNAKIMVIEAKAQGEAIKARAENSKLALVSQAQAEKESAKLKAEAVAIMGEAAKNYPEYRQQEFISGFTEALQEGKINQIVYVPTEAMIPIMEAGKR